jgi:hypothetical protein
LFVGQFGNVEIGHVLRKKFKKNPGEPLYFACSFLHYWTGLQSNVTQKLINSGVDMVVEVAVKLLGKKNEDRSKVPLLNVTAADYARSPEEEI